MRRGKNPEDELMVLINFDVNYRASYRVPVPREGDWREIFNSDAVEFGGSGKLNEGVLSSRPEDCHGFDNSVLLNVPPLAGAIYKRVGPSSYVPPKPPEEKIAKPAPRRRAAASPAAKSRKKVAGTAAKPASVTASAAGATHASKKQAAGKSSVKKSSAAGKTSGASSLKA